MRETKPKNIPKKVQEKDKLTWTDPLFPTGETPSPKTNVLGRYLRGSPETCNFAKLYDKLYTR